jgi:hypothetical protein
MENVLQKDIIEVIARYLCDCDIIRFFQINKGMYEFSKSESFWNNRFISIYGLDLRKLKPINISWKTYYVSISKCVFSDNLNDCMINAIKNYDYVITFFIALGANNWERGLYHAALRGSLGWVKYFMSEHKNISWGLFAASKNHHIHIIDHLEGCGLPIDYVFGLCGAAEGGHEDLVDYFEKMGGGLYGGWEWALQKSSKAGNLNMTKYIIGKGAKNFEGGIIWASIGGHLEIIKFYKELGYKEFDYPLFNASLHGHIELCKYLVGEGADVNLGLAGAAGGGYLNLVKYFVEEANATNLGDALFQAAENGSYDIIEYLIERGCQSWFLGLRGAIYGQHEDLIQFFLTNLNDV